MFSAKRQVSGCRFRCVAAVLQLLRVQCGPEIPFREHGIAFLDKWAENPLSPRLSIFSEGISVVSARCWQSESTVVQQGVRARNGPLNWNGCPKLASITKGGPAHGPPVSRMAFRQQLDPYGTRSIIVQLLSHPQDRQLRPAYKLRTNRSYDARLQSFQRRAGKPRYFSCHLEGW
jgi:hypothetical protein